MGAAPQLAVPVHAHSHMQTHAHRHTQVHTCTLVHICTHIHKCTNTLTHICIHCTYTTHIQCTHSTYAYTHKHTYLTHMHVHMRAHTPIFALSGGHCSHIILVFLFSGSLLSGAQGVWGPHGDSQPTQPAVLCGGLRCGSGVQLGSAMVKHITLGPATTTAQV